MIEVKNLTKAYGDRVAVSDLSFSIQKGEVVGLLGPNGAGKSTTMKVITGALAPTHGQVSVSGYDLSEEPLMAKSLIGYLPEAPPVYGDMRVFDYLVFVAELKGVPKEKISSSVEYAIKKTHLEDVSKRLIQNLSKGFQQRVGIAQALVNSPSVLVLDEPTVGLDPQQVTEIRDLILSLRGERTVILSSHILTEVQAVCEKVVVINQGKIVAVESIKNLQSKITGGSVLKVRLSELSASSLSTLESVDGVSRVNKVSQDLVEIYFNGSEATTMEIAKVAAGLGLLELSPKEQQLESIFLGLLNEGQGGANE